MRIRAGVLVWGTAIFILGFHNLAFGQPFYMLYQKNGTVQLDQFGYSVASAGDINGDGKADFIIGAIGADPGGLSGAGSAFVYSGTTGALLYQKNGAAGDGLGCSVAGAGDVNGDGKGDFIVSAPNANHTPGNFGDGTGSVYVYSGADGSLLYQKDGTAYYYWGWSVAGGGDVDGDGIGDFIIGARNANHTTPGGADDGSGAVYVYSGATGLLLYQKNGVADSDHIGWSVASAGDVNGDGKADFITGTLNADPGGIYEAGSAYVYSGADGALLYQKDGSAIYYDLGYSVGGAGDVNGDGKDDFIVGALGSHTGSFGFRAGSAYVYSGADGSLLYQKDGGDAPDGSDNFGLSVAGAGDADGDGKADFVIGAPATNSSLGQGPNFGSAYLYSGADGSLLYRKEGTYLNDGLGNAVAGGGDVNGDGKGDIIIGASFALLLGRGNVGSAYVCVSCPADPSGDMNASGDLTPADVVLMLTCVFLGTGDCNLCIADVNCSGDLTPSDVVIELNGVFLGVGISCP